MPRPTPARLNSSLVGFETEPRQQSGLFVLVRWITAASGNDAEPRPSSPSFEVQVDNGVGLGTVSGLCDGPGPPSSRRFQSQQGTKSPDDAQSSGASFLPLQNNQFRV